MAVAKLGHGLEKLLAFTTANASHGSMLGNHLRPHLSFCLSLLMGSVLLRISRLCLSLLIGVCLSHGIDPL